MVSDFSASNLEYKNGEGNIDENEKGEIFVHIQRGRDSEGPGEQMYKKKFYTSRLGFSPRHAQAAQPAPPVTGRLSQPGPSSGGGPGHYP